MPDTYGELSYEINDEKHYDIGSFNHSFKLQGSGQREKYGDGSDAAYGQYEKGELKHSEIEETKQNIQKLKINFDLYVEN